MIAEEEAIQNLTEPVLGETGLEPSFNLLAKEWVEETLFVLVDSYRGLFKDAQTIFESNYQSIPSFHLYLYGKRTNSKGCI